MKYSIMVVVILIQTMTLIRVLVERVGPQEEQVVALVEPVVVQAVQEEREFQVLMIVPVVKFGILNILNV